MASNYLKKKGVQNSISGGKEAPKFIGFNSRGVTAVPFTPTEEETPGFRLDILTLAISVKTSVNHISKLEQLVYDFKVGHPTQARV